MPPNKPIGLKAKSAWDILSTYLDVCRERGLYPWDILDQWANKEESEGAPRVAEILREARDKIGRLR